MLASEQEHMELDDTVGDHNIEFKQDLTRNERQKKALQSANNARTTALER